MDAGQPALRTTHMELAGGKLHVIPPQRDQLTRAQTVPIAKQDRRDISAGAAIEPHSVNQRLNLSLGEVFPRACWSNCYTYWRWCLRIKVRVFHGFVPFEAKDCYSFIQNSNSRFEIPQRALHPQSPSQFDAVGQQPHNRTGRVIYAFFRSPSAHCPWGP